ncbi:MAG TPA: hypothetical protein ENN53_06675 [Candidatus Acetothermia bacterium]|nr:hypothetical protein [Candidatus Acetothermia bacterium]
MRTKLALLILALVGSVALAQGMLNPFDAGLGVRAMGFGGASTALAEGTESLLANPAGLGWTSGMRADSSLSSILGIYSVTWLSAAMPNLAGGLAYLGVGGIVDPEGNPLRFSQFALAIAAGLDLGPFRIVPFPAAAGVGIKYASVHAADESGSGFALDLGFLARTTTPFGEGRLGIAIQELGFGPTIGEEGDGWSTAFALGLGLAHPLGLTAALDLTSEYTAFGVGWSWARLVEVRGGLRIQGVLQWAFGLGVEWGMFALDYALLTHPVLSASHRFGFGVKF